MYGNLVTVYETQFEENEKMRNAIIRRVERYNHNERNYRAEIKLLQRELRVRYGYEKDALETNRAMFLKYQAEIGDNIDNYMNQVSSLEEEQIKEIARKYRSEVARTKKSIEEKRMKTGEDGDQLKEQEAQIKHHLDLITNIAQRIDGENHHLREKNATLKANYKEQQIEREKLVKQLVLQKKENQKLSDGIKEYQVELQKAEADRDEEPVDLDKIAEEQQDIVSKKTQAKSQMTMNQNAQGGVGGRTSTQSFLPTNQQLGPLFYEPTRKVESEEEKIVRYERVIETLRKQMENERKLLKQARSQLNRDITQKTELEVLLKQAVDKVMNERKAHKKQSQQRVYTSQPGMGVTSQKVTATQAVVNEQNEQEQELTQHERERVIELMLS